MRIKKRMYYSEIFTIENFLDLDECTKFIDLINNPVANYSHFTDSGKFDNRKWNDEGLAEVFWNKLSAANLKTQTPLLRPNKLIMTGRYVPGDSFSLHTDTGLYYNAKTHEESTHTLLIYLNDDFEGGETIFYNDNFKEIRRIKPQRGMALLFDIRLWHCGMIVSAGEKYWIGCEIIGKF